MSEVILVADDEKEIADLVEIYLVSDGYKVFKANNAADGLEILEKEEIHLVLLDIMMPGMDGLTVLKKLREAGCRTPILLLTAKSETEDQIRGLDLGADDYLPKPFSMRLLLARVRAMLRRREEFTPDILTCGNVSLNRQNSELSAGGLSFALPKQEYRLMELLMLNHGIFLSTEDLLVKVWGYDTDAELGTVWVYISYLRKRLAALHANVTITARRNVGYTLEVTE